MEDHKAEAIIGKETGINQPFTYEQSVNGIKICSESAAEAIKLLPYLKDFSEFQKNALSEHQFQQLIGENVQINAEVKVIRRGTALEIQLTTPSIPHNETDPLQLAKKLRERGQFDIDKEMQNYYIPLEGCRYNNYSKPFPLIEEVQKVLNQRTSVLLLLGNAGAGKTTFCQYLGINLRNLYSEEKEGALSLETPIVLYIMLAAYANPKERLIEKVLERYGLSTKQVNILKEKKQKFIFIFDGYDEIPRKNKESDQNFHVINHLYDWNAQVIFSCRSSYLMPRMKDYYKCFAWMSPQSSLDRSPTRYQEIGLVPFLRPQIEDYIKQYVSCKKHQESEWKNWGFSEYIDYINLTGLEALIGTPFLLYTLMDTLPVIVKDFKKKEHTKEKLQLTVAKLYDYFVQRYFERQEAKLIGKGEYQDNLIEDFQRYSQALAEKMYELDLTDVTYKPIYQTRFGKPQSIPEEEKWKEEFFNSEDKELVKIREGCPLRRLPSTENEIEERWAFMHSSLQDYFASTELFESLLKADLEASLQKNPPQSVSPQAFFSLPSSKASEVGSGQTHFNTSEKNKSNQTLDNLQKGYQ